MEPLLHLASTERLPNPRGNAGVAVPQDKPTVKVMTFHLQPSPFLLLIFLFDLISFLPLHAKTAGVCWNMQGILPSFPMPLFATDFIFSNSQETSIPVQCESQNGTHPDDVTWNDDITRVMSPSMGFHGHLRPFPVESLLAVAVAIISFRLPFEWFSGVVPTSKRDYPVPVIDCSARNDCRGT